MSRNCNEEKVKWLDYVENFMETSPAIENDLYGNWINIVERERRQKKINQDHYESKQQSEQARGHEIATGENEEESTGTQQSVVPNRPEPENQGDQPSNQQDLIEEPRASDFKIPEDEEAMTEMITKLMDLGLSQIDAMASIEKRRKAYEKAMKKHTQMKSKKQNKAKPRKESQPEKC